MMILKKKMKILKYEHIKKKGYGRFKKKRTIQNTNKKKKGDKQIFEMNND
jgi:hypothetical protein